MKEQEVDIVIIGAGLTGLTLAYYLNKAGKKFILLEKSDVVGGVIKTHKEEGFVFEGGPTTGVIGSEEIVELFDDLKEDCKLELTNDNAGERWILKNNIWEPLPTGLGKAIKTPLFSLRDKFRILGEPFRKRGTNPNESLASMVKRRLGKSFLDYAVDPFVSGIYAGDPDLLITKYALPKLYNLEQQYGSFIKGAIKKKKEPKTELQKRVSRAVFSVKGGLGNLIQALNKNIPEEAVYCGVESIKVNPLGSKFKVSYDNNSREIHEIIASKVITTVGGYVLPEILPFVNSTRMVNLSSLLYAKVMQVAVGYNNWTGRSLNAFGGLVPANENKDILGILFPGSLFEGRCPNNGALLSVFVGGIKKPHLFEKTDDEIKKIVSDEIMQTLNEQNKPDFIRIFRYPRAIPQYDILTEKRIEEIVEIETKYPGLILAGNIRDGIGMADRVSQAKKLAIRLLVE